MSVSPSSVTPKESVVVSGFGFAPNSHVKIVYRTNLKTPYNVTLCATTAAADGLLLVHR